MENDVMNTVVFIFVWSFVCMFIGYIFGAQK